MSHGLNIFVGYDRREVTAFHVLQHSIIRRASCPVSIMPIALPHLRRLHTREPVGSTEFSLSRFLTPYLSGYEGYALYLDCDIIVRVDLADILLHTILQPDKSVWVVQHDYTPRTDTKMWGAENKPYPRKNWSSAILWDASKCRMLTPAHVNDASPMELHRFAWLPDEQIGSLPLEWNWLIGEYPANPDAKILHYTLGTPNIKSHETCDHADLWWAEYADMLTPIGGVQP